MTGIWEGLSADLRRVIVTGEPESEFAKLQLLGNFAYRTATIILAFGNPEANAALMMGTVSALIAPTFLYDKVKTKGLLSLFPSDPSIYKNSPKYHLAIAKHVRALFGAQYLRVIDNDYSLELFLDYLQEYWISSQDLAHAFTLGAQSPGALKPVEKVISPDNNPTLVDDLPRQLRLPPDSIPLELLTTLFTKIRVPPSLIEEYSLESDDTDFLRRRLALLGSSLVNLYQWEYVITSEGSAHEISQLQMRLFHREFVKERLEEASPLDPEKTFMVVVGLLYFLHQDMSMLYDYFDQWLTPDESWPVRVPSKMIDGKPRKLSERILKAIDRLPLNWCDNLKTTFEDPWTVLLRFYSRKLDYSSTPTVIEHPDRIEVWMRRIDLSTRESYQEVGRGKTLEEAQQDVARRIIQQTCVQGVPRIPSQVVLSVPEVPSRVSPTEELPLDMVALRATLHLDEEPWLDITDAQLYAIFQHDVGSFVALEREGDRILERIALNILGKDRRFKSELVRNTTLYCLFDELGLCCRVRLKQGRKDIKVKHCADVFEALLGLMVHHLGFGMRALTKLQEYMEQWWFTPEVIARVRKSQRLDNCEVEGMDVRKAGLQAVLKHCP